MNVRLILFTLAPGSKESAEKLFDELNVISRKQKGFRGNVYFSDDSKGEYGAINYWNSAMDADAASLILGPMFEQKVEPAVQETPVVKIFEVYDPLEKNPVN
ncbi:hypothetical protein N0M98_19500 [Paenibacillus doosanensis]|uniref:Monooxygenase n=1 Tax=Paenibacillus konkukensis TaxID=2020716 RepID=A0ABY4RHF7_9BACL|nr:MULTISPECIES: hypothetical protein [Paenibacillus]MCS7462330.1 hypothetical protein [Paenibacillus doosanensis]UQZ80857.1 hypothetical protein SK3146_00013 [Paenibacillus konkukensis]